MYHSTSASHEDTVNALLRWCRAVCACYGLKVRLLPCASTLTCARSFVKKKGCALTHACLLAGKLCASTCVVNFGQVTNFTTSFSDGRALCFLINFYHPQALPRTQISSSTTATVHNDLTVDSAVCIFEWGGVGLREGVMVWRKLKGMQL